ncbi:MAG: potassium channel family protein [Peptococcaceae bacterium]
MKKQVAVIGLGRFGTSVALTLSHLGHEVLVIDMEQVKVNEIINDVTHAVVADAKDEETLKALGVRNVDIAVVAIGVDVQANILISLMLKEIGVAKVISKAQDPLHGKVLEKIGVDHVVYPERDMGMRVAHNLDSANFMDFIELSSEHSIVELKAPENFTGKTLGQLNLRAKYSVSVMAIKKGERIVVAPGADAGIEDGDLLVIIGENNMLAKLK